VLLLLSLATLALTTLTAPGASELEATGASLVAAIPGLFGWFWELADVLLIAWAVALVVASMVARHRGRLLRDQIVALALVLGGAALLVSEGTSVWHAATTTGPPLLYPAVRLALAATVITSSSPHWGARFAGSATGS